MGLKDAGIRAELDQTNETLGKKSALASRKSPTFLSSAKKKKKPERSPSISETKKTRNFIREQLAQLAQKKLRKK